MAKRAPKSPPLPVPQTRDEADALLGRIGTLSRAIDRIDTDLADAVAKAKAAAQAQAKPLAAELTVAIAALAAWADTARTELLAGGGRSVTMAQGSIGWRWGRPTVTLARGVDEDALVATLARLGLTDLLRTTTAIDRTAILRAPGRVEGIAGIAVAQTETFWVRPLEARTERAVTATTLRGAEATRAPDAEEAA